MLPLTSQSLHISNWVYQNLSQGQEHEESLKLLECPAESIEMKLKKKKFRPETEEKYPTVGNVKLLPDELTGLLWQSKPSLEHRENSA